jgi:hypothetical protein
MRRPQSIKILPRERPSAHYIHLTPQIPTGLPGKEHEKVAVKHYLIHQTGVTYMFKFSEVLLHTPNQNPSRLPLPRLLNPTSACIKLHDPHHPLAGIVSKVLSSMYPTHQEQYKYSEYSITLNQISIHAKDRAS